MTFFSSSLKIGKRNEILILLLCFVIGFTLRVYTFGQKSLWIDEIHTFNDSRGGIKSQIEYFKEKPLDYLHPPLFFVITHVFYPFEKPEREIRIFPLIFGIISVPMIYFLAKSFSPSIAFPSAFSLAFMAYHISFSQDGRPYSMIMFFGMVALYFFLKILKTHQKKYLFITAFLYAILFYLSYSSIPFIVLSQILWFYQLDGKRRKDFLSSFLILNLTTLILCAPWIIFIAMNYKSQAMDIVFKEDLGSLWSIFVGIFNDWAPHTPLMITSAILLILFPIFSKNKKNAFILLALFILPVILLYLFCKIFDVHHYFSSRYLINFLPVFIIILFLSLLAIEERLRELKGVQLRFLFVIFFIVSNAVILPFYYRSEKQDFRGLVSYLEGQLQDRDKIFVKSIAYIPGLLHYLKVYPESRHYNIPGYWIDREKKEFEYRVSLVSEDKKFTIYFSNSNLSRYVEDGSRLWIIAGKPSIKEIKTNYPLILKGYFDGTFCNFRRFPSDASMYLFLWDPKSPEEKGIELPIE